jgi:tetrahydromethanopterin S-methyltransferase subunit G
MVTLSLERKGGIATMKKVIRLSVVVLLLLLTLTMVVHAQEGQPAETATTGGVALLLAPLVAAATAIERMIEMGFSWFESLVISASTFLNVGGSYVKWARDQVNTCRKALIDAPAADISAAEEALNDAEQRLKQWVASEPYLSIKRGLAVLFGIILGIIVAWVSKLQMFKLLGVNLIALNGAENNPALGQFLTSVDVLVTGLIIGTGSAPVHSLIGILQKSKDAIDEARALARARSLEAVAGLVAAAAPRKGFAAAPGKVAAAEAPSSLEMERRARRMLD